MQSAKNDLKKTITQKRQNWFETVETGKVMGAFGEETDVGGCCGGQSDYYY